MVRKAQTYRKGTKGSWVFPKTVQVFEFLIFIIFKGSYKLNLSVSRSFVRLNVGNYDELCNVLVAITRV
jgi:hypothetical protein